MVMILRLMPQRTTALSADGDGIRSLRMTGSIDATE
jgi:hypothetical protein